jgi:putative transposase
VVDFVRKKIRLRASRYLGRGWYFLTLCTDGRTARLDSPELVRLLITMLQERGQAEGFVPVAYCFMADHLHLLVSGSSEHSNLLSFVKGFKQRTSYWFKRTTGQQLWQRYYYDHILRTGERWEGVATYIWMNPVRKGLCAKPEQWPYSGSATIDWQRLIALGCEPWVPPWKGTASATQSP